MSRRCVLSARHCKRPYRSDVNILSYLWNENNKLNAKYCYVIRKLDMNAKMQYVPQEKVHGTIIELLIISVAAKPWVWQQLVFVLWKLKRKKFRYVFTAWQNTRMNKKAQLETAGGNGLESTNVDDLSVPLKHMSANSSNFWLCKFICELRS